MGGRRRFVRKGSSMPFRPAVGSQQPLSVHAMRRGYAVNVLNAHAREIRVQPGPLSTCKVAGGPGR